MDSMDRSIIRNMAWERAKGELKSMLQTYVGEVEKFKILKKAIADFTEDVEMNGKAE